MSTLIASTASKFRRACNAKCYNAKRPECDCLCGGVNHAVGEVQARKNCREMGLSWTVQTQRTVSFKRRRFIPEQTSLFPDLESESEESIVSSVDVSPDTDLPNGHEPHIQNSFAF